MKLFDLFRSAKTKSSNSDLMNVISNNCQSITRLSDARLLKVYEQNEWVASAVKVRSEAFASTDFFVEQSVNSGESEKLKKTKALSLLENPNKVYTGYDLKEMTSMHLDLVGQAFWYLVKGPGTDPIEIFIINPTQVEVVWKGLTISHFKIRKDNGMFDRLELDEMIWFRENSPIDTKKVSSPLQAAVQTVLLEESALDFNQQTFKNGGKISLKVIAKKALSAEVFKQFKKNVLNTFSGNKNANRVFVADNGADVEDMGSNQRDMEFSEMQKFSRDKLLSVYRVSKSILGILDDVNRATIEGSQFGFQEFANKPKLQRFKATINAFYLPLFAEFKNKEVSIGYTDPAPKNKELHLKQDEMYLKNGVISPDEKRKELGLDGVKGGEEPRVNSSQIPLSTDPAKIAPKIAPKNPAKSLKKNFALKTSVEDIMVKYIERFDTNEQGLQVTWKDIFAAQEKSILRNIANSSKSLINKDFTPENAGFVPVEETAKYAEKLNRTMLSIAISEGQTAMLEIGFDASDFVPTKQFRQAIIKQTQKFALKINQSTFESLKTNILKALDAGGGEVEVAAAVEHSMDIAKKSRSFMIARTETLRASNVGYQESYVQNDVEKKEWVHVSDARPTHQTKQVVKIQDKFLIGGEYLRFPGDPNGSAKEVINCRCRIVANFE